MSCTLAGVVIEPDEEQNLEIQHKETPPSLIEETDNLGNITSAIDNSLTEEEKRLDNRFGPLAIWLQKVPLSTESISLSFQDIETFIGDELSTSARSNRIWWSNNLKLNPQSRAWWEAGWRVATVKMAEEVVVFARVEGRKKAYIHFFSSLLQQLNEQSTFPMRSLSPDGESWITIASLPSSGLKLATLGFSFARRNRFRVDLYIDRGSEEENKALFNKLLDQKNSIESEIGMPLNWEYLKGAIASRIALYHKGAITDTEKELELLRSWAIDVMIRLQKIMDKYLSEVL